MAINFIFWLRITKSFYQEVTTSRNASARLDDSDLIIYREKWLFMSQSAAIHERHRNETPFYTNEKKNF